MRKLTTASAIALLLGVLAMPVHAADIFDLSQEPASASFLGIDLIDQSTNGAIATGDVNGDRKDDLIIAVREGDGPGNTRDAAGDVWVIFGKDFLVPHFEDLAQQPPDLVIWGATPGVRMGSARWFPRSGQEVAAGDINGDGYDDIIIGSPYDLDSQQGVIGAGRVYVIFGKSNLPATIDLAAPHPSTRFLTIIGKDPGGPTENGDRLGHAVAIGNFNGDKFDDLVVGSPDADGPPNDFRANSGQVDVFLGRKTWPLVIDLFTESANVTVYAADAHDQFGFSVAMADTNGDKFDDLVIGDTNDDGPGETRILAGAVSIINGGLLPALPLSIDLKTTPPDTIIYGVEALDRLGYYLHVGYLNLDKYADVVVSALSAYGPGNTRIAGGEVYVIRGAPSLPATIDLAVDSPSLTIYGADAFDRLGHIETGNVSGTKHPELILAAEHADGIDNAKTDSGEIYVLDGAVLFNQSTIDLQNDNFTGLRIVANQGDFLGALAVGNFNGDLFLDLLAGASGADGPNDLRPAAGVSFVFLGNPFMFPPVP